MVDQSFSESEQQALLTEFAKIENDSHCGGSVSDCVTAIQKLEEAYR